MKKLILISLVCFLIPVSTQAELTEGDLTKIGEVIRKTVKEEITMLRWWLTGITALVGVVIIGLVTVAVFTTSHTSKAVDKVRDFRDEIIRHSVDHEKSINEHVETIVKGIGEIRQSESEVEERLNTAKELVDQSVAHADRVFSLAGEVLERIEPIIDELDEDTP